MPNYGSEIKATKLLERKRFKWAEAASKFPAAERRELARCFLARTARREQPPPEMWRAFDQASLEMARGIVGLMPRRRLYAFASMIPCGAGRKPQGEADNFVRKDMTFLFERFYYFLQDNSFERTPRARRDRSDRRPKAPATD